MVRVCIPFWIIGIKKLQTVSKGSVQDKMTLALAGAFIFVLSALKIPQLQEVRLIQQE